MKKIIETPNSPEAIGPYSQGVRTGDFLYVSGQIALDRKSGELKFAPKVEFTPVSVSTANSTIEEACRQKAPARLRIG